MLFCCPQEDEDQKPAAHAVEPNTTEELKKILPDNVKIFFPPKDGATPDEKKKIIQEIKEAIQESEDGPIRKFWKDGNSEPGYTYTSGKHFSSKHYALLFAPGEYEDCDFEVGYYTQMAGLGASAADVRFTGTKSGPFVEALNKDLPVTEGGTIATEGSGLSLDTFWRSAENFTSKNLSGLLWSVSQAAPLRRIRVEAVETTTTVMNDDGEQSETTRLVGGNLELVEGAAYASGGFLANAYVEQQVMFGGQQQWFARNVQFKGNHEKEGPLWPDGPVGELQTVGGVAWNLVLSGCDIKDCKPKPPQEGVNTNDGANKATTIDSPSVKAEKPFIVLNGEKWELHVPNAEFDPKDGTNLVSKKENSSIRNFATVKVAVPRKQPKNEDDMKSYNKLDRTDKEKTKELQKALDEGKDLVLCPGEYFLTRSLEVTSPNQVILGLGLATLIAPKDGSPCIRIKASRKGVDTSGVRIAGVQLEASVQEFTFPLPGSTRNSDGVKSLLEIGEPHVADNGDPKNPIVLSDIFARVGGSNLDRTVSTNVMVRVHTGHVVGDNLWLWRADHVKLRFNEEPNDARFPLYYQIRDKNLCQVKNALVVNGDNVTMYGLFCEHTNEHQMIWKGNNGKTVFFQCELPYDADGDFVEDRYAGYFIHDNAQKHEAKGIGVYSNFTVNDIFGVHGIRHPKLEKGIDMYIVHPLTVWLNGMGGIQHVMNRVGGEVRNNGTGKAMLSRV